MLLPSDFIARTKALLGDEYSRLEAALDAPSPVSIRLNRSKRPVSAGGEPVGWCPAGRYLPERPPFTFDPLFHAGAYYVQEASSMFLEQVVRTYVDTPVRCLDLCAAPGGKSTHLLDALPAGSLLVANEVIRGRSQILAENCTKWGNPFVIVTNNDPEQIGRLHHYFDMILADLPCSGEGMFRKDPDSIGQWSVDNVRLCAARGRRIIQDVWDALKPGGLLVYSTCTYNLEENEENIRHLIEALGAKPLPVPIEEAWNITNALRYDFPVYRFFPHKTTGEGFFLAVLQKPDEEREPISLKGKKTKAAKNPPAPAEVRHWLNGPDDYRLEIAGSTIQAFPRQYIDDYRTIASLLRVVSSGISLGEIKGKDILPAHPLAINTAFNTEAFEQVAVSWEEAIRYLRKQAITLSTLTAKGYIIIMYKGFPLGFAKQLVGRANNLYPSEWRIRSTHSPDVPVEIIP